MTEVDSGARINRERTRGFVACYGSLLSRKGALLSVSAADCSFRWGSTPFFFPEPPLSVFEPTPAALVV
jgi:hypothetical protein